MRESKIIRNTRETKIEAVSNIDGSGQSKCDTGCGFLDHMLDLLACHGNFDLEITCIGDKNVDYHHSTEDIGIVLGQAFCEALGDKAGIRRFGSAIIPMDEALVLSAIDLSGRACLGYDLKIPTEKVGDFDTELVAEFMSAFSRELKAAVHIRGFAGENSHHIIEAAFKSLARALKEAVALDEKSLGKIPSTKGVL